MSHVCSSILIASIIACTLSLGCHSTTETASSPMTLKDGWNRYGAEVETAAQPVALGSLKGTEQNVVLKGVITEVCLHQGCWLKIKDSKNPAAGELFIRTKDHMFLIPRNAHGHEVVLHGFAEYKEMSVKDQQHYAEEAGRSAEEIARITQPKTEVTFIADSILIKGPGLDKAADQD